MRSKGIDGRRIYGSCAVMASKLTTGKLHTMQMQWPSSGKLPQRSKEQRVCHIALQAHTCRRAADNVMQRGSPFPVSNTVWHKAKKIMDIIVNMTAMPPRIAATSHFILFALVPSPQ
jgi:hypothetical protein